MSAKQISQWRTVAVAVFACLLLAAVFLVVIVRASPLVLPLDLSKADRLYEALADAVVWLIVAVAFKASVEHLGKGGGLRGVRDALLNDSTKPADKPEEPKP